MNFLKEVRFGSLGVFCTLFSDLSDVDLARRERRTL